MKCAVHQPHFFPWLGYLAKIASSDVFILLDDVQFTRRNFQNRCKIISTNGAENWLSVSLVSAPQTHRINQMLISPAFQPNPLMAKLDAVYKKSPYYPLYRDEIHSLLQVSQPHLKTLTIQTMQWLLKVIKIPTHLNYLSSALSLPADIDPNQRIITLCQYHGATQYIAGSGGKNYMDVDQFREANIEILWQDFKQHPIQYNSVDGKFHFGLSSLDALFSLGPVETRELVYSHAIS
jgi:hypothetical protein